MNDHHRRLATILALLLLIQEVGGSEGQDNGERGADEGHQQLFCPIGAANRLPFGHSNTDSFKIHT